VVFASETCAFDLLRAKYERDVLPGELIMVNRRWRVTSRQYAPPNQGPAASSSMFTCAARQQDLWTLGAGEPRGDGPPAGA